VLGYLGNVCSYVTLVALKSIFSIQDSKLCCGEVKRYLLLLHQKAEMQRCVIVCGDCFVSKRRFFDSPECRNCIYKGSSYCWGQCSLNVWKRDRDY